MEISNIKVFFEKSDKCENDHFNKIRETIIKLILNGNIPKTWYNFNETNGKEWYKVALRLKEFVGILEKEYGTFKEVIHKGGRSTNDFIFNFDNKSIKVEFKSGFNELTKLPQIRDKPAKHYIKGIEYAEFFYDKYLQLLDPNGELPSKKDYLKYHYTDQIRLPFIQNLKVNYNEVLNKPIVDDSLNEYLPNFLEFDFEAFQKDLDEIFSKKFMLWNNEQFYLKQFIDEKHKIIIPEYKLKGGKDGINSIVIQTIGGEYEYHLRLRWKNTTGILFTAWQIILIDKKTYKMNKNSYIIFLC